jgi:hypothetical protein
MFERLLLPVLILALGACSGNDASPGDEGLPPLDHGGQTGTETHLCDVEERALGVDETSPIGISVADIVGALSSESSTEFAPHSSEGLDSGNVHVRLASVSEHLPERTRFRAADGAECEDDIAFETELSFETEDGAFSEWMPAEVQGTSASAVSVHATLPFAALRGSYEPSRFDPEQYTALDLVVLFNLDAGGYAGTVSIHAASDSDPEGVSTTEFVLGTF